MELLFLGLIGGAHTSRIILGFQKFTSVSRIDI